MIQKLGKYAMVEKLGEGSMGAVYKAYDSALDRYVAIKTMAEDIQWNPELKLRFYREARSAATIHHPNIVTIHDLGEEGKITYIVMELLQGTDLKTLIADRTPLPLEEKIAIIAQVADGLNHAHLHGIVHRDIKPGNIYVSSSGNVKILDFGIARIPGSDLTRTGERLGTPVYMAPEQLRGKECDARADIFAAGVVFYELITYVHPFRDKKIAKTMDNILFQNPCSIVEYFPDAPGSLWPIISRCIAKEPKERYAGMDDLARSCRDVLAELTLARQDMSKDLEAAVPLLRQRVASADGPTPLRELLQEVQKVLGHQEKADFLTLLHLSSALSKESLWPSAPGTALPPRDPRKEDQPAKAESAGGDGRAGAQASNNADAPGPARPDAPVTTPSPGSAAASISRRTETIAKGTEPIPPSQGAPSIPVSENEMPVQAPVRNVEDVRARTRSELAEALQLFRVQELDKARTHAMRALELSPENADATAILAWIDEALEKKRGPEALAGLLAQAEQALGRKELDVASNLANRARQLAPSNQQIVKLLDRIQQTKEELHRQEDVAQLLLKVEESLGRKDFDEAESQAQQALKVIPEHPRAVAFFNRIHQAREDQRRFEVIHQAIGEAEQAFVAGNLDQCETQAHHALEIDPRNREAGLILARVTQAREKIKADQISTLLEQARAALAMGDFSKAGASAREVLLLDAQDKDALKLLSDLGPAQEKRKRDEIAGFLSRSREALGRQRFAEAEELAKMALALDPNYEETKALGKEIASAIRAQERQQRKERASSRRTSQVAPAPAGLNAGAEMAPTVILARPRGRKGWKIIGWAGIAIVVLGAFFGVFYLTKHKSIPQKKAASDVVSQIITARSELDQRRFDQAIEIAQSVLAVSPDDSQAHAILSEAQKQKRQANIDVLMVEVQQLRSQNRIEDANKTIQRVLDIDPAYEPALAVRSEMEAEVAASKSKEAQEKLIQDGLAKVDSLLQAGNLADAKSQIDRLARLQPNASQIAAARQRWNSKSAEGARRDADAQKLKAVNDLGGKAEGLYQQGKYAEARDVLAQLLATAPQNGAAQSLNSKSNEALACLKAYEDAISAKEYDGALGAVSRLEKVNPSDPNIAGLRKRAESSKATAKATFAIYRIGEPGVLMVDGQQVGTGGEIENEVVSAGRHKLEVRFNNGKQSSLELNLLEGQNLAFVYDATAPALRAFTPADRDALARRRQREEIHRFPVDHLHGLLKGKCSGELLISGLRVEYKPAEGDHHFLLLFANLTLDVKEDRLEFTETPGDKRYQFRARDAQQAGLIKTLWAGLQKLSIHQ